jgi:UDP-GlcNAc:undecaprenyl-phosphate GlcNAc-1-phosphate transferase
MQFVVGGLSAFLFGLLLTPLARALAHHKGVVAAPRKDRWHQKPTAMLGGVAIYQAFALGCLIFAPEYAELYPILMAATLMFATGLVDDLVQIKPQMKLAAQLGVALIVVYAGGRLHWTNSEAVNVALTIFWLVGITNAINLLDNMDGLAGGVSWIASLFLLITFLLNGQLDEALVAALLWGALLAFLVFNFNPASIFMGDCGSLFLGFLLGAMPLLTNRNSSPHLAITVLTPILLLVVPIFDTCLVTVMRKLAGRAISQGGRDHSSHRLVALGLSERGAVGVLYLLQTVSGLLALVINRVQIETGLLLAFGYGLLLLLLGGLLGRVRVYETQRHVQSPGFSLPVQQ